MAENADFYYGGARRASPETKSLDGSGPSSRASSSPPPSVCEKIEMEQREDDDDEYEVTNSYGTDDYNHYHGRGSSNSIDIEEAIAWAKERFLRPDTKPQFTETECRSYEGSFGNSTWKPTTTEDKEESNS
ncbi:PREDICTED: uncharacterized protein LOC104814311 isoform X1 [Tarenaya hassleriana]|uniref:uncharacterized protein LOC104814311 isoform X1 n=1 Tax=Tarenaya hassleriana TaxID=28532 RepID=UPI00053C7FE9|nr:PREDICTED: uncharacterized protein LOC104814311 isoform X1 [Tarenaya hassleriana]